MSNNIYDVVSTIEHEGFHKEFGKVKSYSDHVKVYMAQAGTENFEMTSKEYKQNHAKQTAQRLINAYAAGEFGSSTSEFSKLINEYNSLNPDIQLKANYTGGGAIKVRTLKDWVEPNLEIKVNE